MSINKFNETLPNVGGNLQILVEKKTKALIASGELEKGETCVKELAYYLSLGTHAVYAQLRKESIDSSHLVKYCHYFNITPNQLLDFETYAIQTGIDLVHEPEVKYSTPKQENILIQTLQDTISTKNQLIEMLNKQLEQYQKHE